MAAKQTRPGDMVELTVTELDDLGAGMGTAGEAPERLQVHVPGALPGERVRARLAHVSAHRGPAAREAWAELGVVLVPSGDRVAPSCPAHGKCGGCALAGLAYPAQLAYKRGRVVAELRRFRALAAVEVDGCAPSPLTAGYRNHAKLVYGRESDSGRVVLGAFAPRSHQVVDLAGCRLVEPALEEARGQLLAVLAARRIEPYDDRHRTSALRYAVLRATHSGRVLVALVAARGDWVEAAVIAQELAAACPVVVGVVLNVNPTAGNRIFGDDERVLWGEAAVDDAVGDVHVRLVARSFFQANRQVAGRIYRAIVAAAPAAVARAVDVYSGAGAIALSLAAVAGEVVAIEENRAATEAAAEHLAGLGAAAGRVRMVTADAAPGLDAVDGADLVVLNPPRKGCAPAVLAAVARLRPGLVAYVSCAPATLARDLAALVAYGARLLRVSPYDMMPQTPHVETLALLAFS